MILFTNLEGFAVLINPQYLITAYVETYPHCMTVRLWQRINLSSGRLWRDHGYSRDALNMIFIELVKAFCASIKGSRLSATCTDSEPHAVVEFDCRQQIAAIIRALLANGEIPSTPEMASDLNYLEGLQR